MSTPIVQYYLSQRGGSKDGLIESVKKFNVRDSLISAMFKEYSNNVDQYVATVVSYLDGVLSFKGVTTNQQDEFTFRLPYYCEKVLRSLQIRNYDPFLSVYPNGAFVTKDIVLLASFTNKYGEKRHLYTFSSSMNDDLDNNCFFVWSGEPDDQFWNFNKETIFKMNKQTTLRSGLELLVA